LIGTSWAGYLFVDNLTDKVAQLSVNTTAFSFPIPSLARVVTNQPRTIGVNLSYRF
jgi:outer membrane receptor protein involved in Fe transport